MNKELKLFTEGKVITKDKKEFTRLLGGFGENKPMITTKYISDLMGYELKRVNETINNNIARFEEGLHIIDLKKIVDDNDHLINLGYSKVAVGRSNSKFYGLSEAGFLLYLKFADGDKAIELYKDFIEEYFKIKAENIVMEKALQEEIEFLKERKKFILGSMFVEDDENKKMGFFNENEKINKKINEIEITLSKEKLVEQLKPQLEIANKFTHASGYYDIGTFSKVLKIKNLGRNNLFEWLRCQSILMKSNQPYQKYLDYFEVLPLENRYTNKIDYKTMVKPCGVEYIVKRLIKDGKIITKSTDDILKEMEGSKITA